MLNLMGWTQLSVFGVAFRVQDSQSRNGEEGESSQWKYAHSESIWPRMYFAFTLPSFCATAQIVPTRTHTPAGSAQTNPLWLSVPSPSLRVFGRMLDLAGWGQFNRSKGAELHYRNQVRHDDEGAEMN